VRKPTALIVGDLSLDAHAAVPINSELLARLAVGADVSAQGDMAVSPGGTSWLFADALASATAVLPLIAATVGGDWQGNLLSDSLIERGFPAQGLVTVPGDRTDVVLTVSFNGSARFMAWPRNKVSRKARAWEWPRVAQLVASYDVRFAWISGYLFDDSDPSLLDDARALFENLRRLHIPIVVDLVPHDFSTRIGSLEELESAIGRIDVLIGEFSTMVDLGFGGWPAQGEDVGQYLIQCARSASVGRIAAVAQHRISNDLYAEAIVSQTSGELVIDKLIPASGPRGLGDYLAVRALVELGLVD
jgi:sugar/nucleoside kinase (ribokinase family)